MAFDQNKYKKIFEQRFGPGSFESGLKSAREVGRKKAQADIAKKLYTKRKSEEKERQEREDKAKEKELDKTEVYGDIPAKEAREMQKKAQAQGRGGYQPTYKNKVAEAKATRKAEEEKKKNLVPDLSEMTPYARQRYLAEQKEKEESESLIGKAKDFFTSKDKDGDGKRDGLLGLFEKIDRPGDAVRSGIKEVMEGGNFFKGAKEGWTDKEYTTLGKDLNKTLGFDPDKDAKDKLISNILGKKVIEQLPLGEFITPFLSNKTKNKVGKETAGFGTEAVLDPLNLIGSGLVAKGAGTLGKAVKGATKATKTVTKADDILGLPAPKPEPLGLPEPQIRLPEPKPLVPNVNKATPKLKNPIPQIPDVMRQPLAQAKFESKGIGFGNGSRYEPKAKDRMMFPESKQNQAYWQKRYEDFAKHVNASYDMNRMTPEALDELWTQFARYDEPVKLDEVIDLAYPKGFEAPVPPKQAVPEPEPIPVSEPTVSTIKDDLAADPRINELVKGLFPPQRPVSRVATPDEVIKMMEETVASQPKKPEDILRPLQFSRERYVRTGSTPSQSSADEVAATLEAGVKPGRDYEPIEPMRAAEELPLLRADDPITDMSFDPTKLKDISGFKAATTDVYRIFRDVFGKDYEKAGKPIINKLDGAKKEYVTMQQDLVSKLKTDVVDKLKIQKGSKESALVQQYGEKKITLEQLKQQAPDKWRDIVKADQWFRQTYDQLIDTINAARSQAYPNRPEKLVPKLDNYYRHFRELNGLEGLKNIFDSPSQIDPHLAGLSQHTNPNSKFHGFMQKRGLGPYKNDAVGGFLEYIPNAAYATHIDQVIPVFKNLRRQLADGTADSKNINNFIEFLYNYSNDLAGKTNPYFDRNLQQLVGRKTMAVLNWVNNRVKKNVILGNIGSTLAQMANIPNGIAYAKFDAPKGAGRTLTSIFDKGAPMHKSPFLQERYLGKIYREFDQRLIDQPEKLAGWMIETSDRIGTSFVWNSVYEKGLKAKVKDPIAYADDITRKLIAGRGIGEVPLMQKSKAVQLVMPFTLEVANLWKVMGDFAKSKDFGALATLFIGNFILNKGMEETRGSAVTFDPIDAIWDAVTDEELTNFQRVGRLGGEVLTNVPLGQHIAGLYPENGQVFNIKGPTRKELFGERDPQRFGTGLVAANSLNDLAFKFALPFGGNQLKKTLSGAEALMNEGSYIKDSPVQLPFVGENQKLRYPVEPDAWNSAKSLMFGPSATNEAQEYYDNKRRPLSENQTAEYEQGGKAYYDNLMLQRKEKTIKKKIGEIEKDSSLSSTEKQKQLLMLYRQLQTLK